MKTLFKFRGLCLEADKGPDNMPLYIVQDDTGSPVLKTRDGQEAFANFMDRFSGAGARVMAAYAGQEEAP